METSKGETRLIHQDDCWRNGTVASSGQPFGGMQTIIISVTCYLIQNNMAGKILSFHVVTQFYILSSSRYEKKISADNILLTFLCWLA